MSQVATRQRRVSRSAGHLIGAAVNGLLLYLIHVSPGWEVLPFLTADTPKVLGWVDASLIAGIVVNLLHLVADPGWLTPAGSLVTAAFGLAATARVLQVFPFAFTTAFDWALVVRILLVVGVVGAAIGVVASLVSLLRILAVQRPQAHHR